MGISSKSHGRKTDQETQSPMLKIFKDMMHRENHDPEKANLLEEQKEERKRKKYSGSRSKSDHRSGDSSNVDRSKKSIPHQTQEQRNVEYDQCRTQSTPFPPDKKDSWWFWGETDKKTEDTCSCVSCALRKLAGSEYVCVGCLLLVFIISVIVAFLLVFKSVPTLAVDEDTPRAVGNLESERLKRKIDYFKDQRNFKDGYATLKEDVRERRAWDDTLRRQLNGLSELSELKTSNYGELQNPEDSGSISADLSKVLGGGKVAEEFQNSERLRDFYKQLLQTDAQIKLLKKGVTDFTLFNTNNNLYMTPFERSKRSLKHPIIVIKRKIKNSVGKGKEITKDVKIMKRKNLGNKMRNKRFDNNETEPNGFLIEKKKLVVQYQPSENNAEVRRKVPKCSHVPKESKSHEKQLKHPFYKNTQRLDELLDQFLDKNLPEIMTDPFNLDLFKNEKSQCKHPTTDKHIDLFKTDGKHQKDDKENDGKVVRKMKNEELRKQMLSDSTSIKRKDNNKHSFNNEKKVTETSTENFNVVLSISTILNPGAIKIRNFPAEDIVERRPTLRKLMQLEDEDESLGYEDEVLADDTETHDDTEKHGERKKRNQILNPQPNEKYHPPRVHNPNWKGPMPLYPDEINSMIKQAALNANKFGLLSMRNAAYGENGVPLSNKDISAEIDKAERDMNDVEYIEDYTNDKYDKLIEMAQAYSDYGVLEDKKLGTSNEKNGDKVNDRKIKLAMDNKSLKRGLFERPKKMALEKSDGIKNKNIYFGKIADPSEGLRFEVKPTSSTGREDNPMDVYKLLQKHLKISHDMKKPNIAPDIDLMYTPTKYDNDKYHTWEHGKNKYGHKSDNPEMDIYALSKGKRSLKSIEYNDQVDTFSNDDDVNFNIDKNITGFEGHHQIKMDAVNNNITNETGIMHKVNNKKVKRETSMYNDSKLYGNILPKNQLGDVLGIQNITSNYFNASQVKNGEFLNKTDLTREATGYSHKDMHENSNYENELISTSFNNTNNIKELNSTDKGMGISDFFTLLSNFFFFMDSLDRSTPQNDTESFLNKSSNISSIAYPAYDSDMIENIAHRSRVLMSVDDTKVTDKSETEDPNPKVELYKKSNDKTDADEITYDTNMTTTVKINNTTGFERDTNDITKENNNKDKGLKNKTVVKRHADDTSLIFWNDIYDDEYGVEINPFENNIRDKHAIKRNNFIKSSGLWFQDKVKKITDNLKKKVEKYNENYIDLKDKNKAKNKVKEKHRISRGINNDEQSLNTKNKYYNRLAKRELNIIKEEMEPGNKDLASLKANMKDICRKAARAVQETRNLKVREDTKEGVIASTLMQQLVRLMTDLVDYQVQQKTCLKLPSDLQNFLEWLVAPTDSASESDFKLSFEGEEDKGLDVRNIDKSTEEYLDMMMRPKIDTEELRLNDKPEPQAVLHAVTDLIRQYELMTDDDKSKMSGIKEYLESQRDFLQKQTHVDEFNMYPNTFYPMRYRRDLKYRSARNANGKQHDRKRKLSKFIKNFGKKHTKTTASSNDAVQITEVQKSKDPKIHDKSVETKRMSRNLRDIYYKAIADAKKMTTSKNNLSSKK